MIEPPPYLPKDTLLSWDETPWLGPKVGLDIVFSFAGLRMYG
jgi:hypothetical protein